MGIKLYKHNEEAYNRAKEMYNEVNHVAVIHPTGTGKSYIALKLIEESKGKRAIYLSPSLQILHQLKRDIFDNGMTMQDFKGLRRMTYQKLSMMSEKEIEELRANII